MLGPPCGQPRPAPARSGHLCLPCFLCRWLQTSSCSKPASRVFDLRSASGSPDLGVRVPLPCVPLPRLQGLASDPPNWLVLLQMMFPMVLVPGPPTPTLPPFRTALQMDPQSLDFSVSNAYARGRICELGKRDTVLFCQFMSGEQTHLQPGTPRVRRTGTEPGRRGGGGGGEEEERRKRRGGGGRRGRGGGEEGRERRRGEEGSLFSFPYPLTDHFQPSSQKPDSDAEM